MQSIDQFNENLGTAILLIGPPGGGKTVLGLRLFPRTYCLVADLNFRSGLDYLRHIKEPLPVGFDTVSVDETGKKVPVPMRYDRMWSKLTEAAANPNIDCILIDSVTLVEDYIKAKICGAPNESLIKLTNYDQWGSYLVTWKGLIMQLRETGKKVIMTCHERKERDESDGIFKYQILVDGQIRERFPGLFSDVWRCEVNEVNQKPVWQVRTIGNVRHELKRTFPFLDPIMTQDDLVKRIREHTPVAAMPTTLTPTPTKLTLPTK